MKYLKYILPVVAVVLTLAASNALRQPPDALPKWQFKTPEGSEGQTLRHSSGQAIGGDEFSVGIGEEFTLELDGNQTTGFRWMAEHDAQKLEFVKDEYIPDTSPEEGEPLIGAGGTHRFTYRTIEAGTAEMIFTYARPWESVEPAKRIVYNIIIE